MLCVTQRFIFFHLTFHLVLKSFVRLIPYYNAYLWWSSLSAKSIWIWYFQAKRLFFFFWPRDNPSKWQSSSEQRHSGQKVPWECNAYMSTSYPKVSFINVSQNSGMVDSSGSSDIMSKYFCNSVLKDCVCVHALSAFSSPKRVLYKGKPHPSWWNGLINKEPYQLGNLSCPKKVAFSWVS